MERIAHRTCPLCEATCGLALTLQDRELVGVRGDDDDVFSKGFICPKAVALIDLESDPDIVRTPLIREGTTFREASWEEAFDLIAQRLGAILTEHGRDAVAVYLGNPNVHNLAGSLYAKPLLKALGTRNIFSATTVDQMPKQLAGGLMFGTGLSVPIPDVDNTMYLLMLGANPMVSNGSLLTAPDMPGRLRALRKRGGKLVVVDPRRTATAKLADEHLPIIPGTDASFLFAIVHTLFEEGLVSLGRLEQHTAGVEQVRALAQRFAPEVVAATCGIDEEVIRRIAREIAAAESAAVYGRIGTCTQEFGTLASWLVDVINVLTGNLDRPGGALFTKPATGSPTTNGTPGKGRGVTIGRHRSRVRGAPEVLGELPVACLAEEILTPGDGQVRALITLAGNPVVSTPGATMLADAVASLDFMVSVDIYLNDTTRHADVILPAEPALSRSHYDIAFYALSCRNIARYSPAVNELLDGQVPEWHTLLRLTGIAAGATEATVEQLDELVARELLARGLRNPSSPAQGVDEDEAWKAIGERVGPERLLDILLRSGPYGDGFGRVPDGLTLELLEQHPHGIDLGPLRPRIPEVLRTPSGMIELAPEPIVADCTRLEAAVGRGRNGSLVLVGRRHLRSNNSWMHNLPRLVGGSNRCTVHINPDDAARLGIDDGGTVTVTSAAGSVRIEAEVTDEVMPGVVSIPHGWGSAEDGHGTVAATQARTNSNVLAPADLIDPLSGNAVLNGIPVSVSPAG